MTSKAMMLLAGLGGAAIASGAFYLHGQGVSAESELATTQAPAAQAPAAQAPVTQAPAPDRVRDRDSSWVDKLRGPKQVEVTVPPATPLTIAIDLAIDSSEMTAGDPIRGKLTSDLTADGHVVARAGAMAHGTVVQRDESGRVKGREHLTLRLDSIATVHGDQTAIQTDHLTLVAQGTKKRDAAVIGGAAAAGAILGAITKGGDGAAKGAAIGGAGGTGLVLATPGEDIELAPGHRLTFTLSAPMHATVEVPRD